MFLFFNHILIKAGHIVVLYHCMDLMWLLIKAVCPTLNLLFTQKLLHHPAEAFLCAVCMFSLYLHAFSPGTLACRCTLPLTLACDPDKDKQKAMDIYLNALTSLRLSEQELGVELLFATEMNEHELRPLHK